MSNAWGSSPLFSDVLHGIAVADAVGNPLEFMDATVEDVLGSLSRRTLVPSDDTQMTLFLAEALATGEEPRNAYVRWYATQTKKYEPVELSEGGLLSFRELYRMEAPGRTCMESCRVLSKGGVIKNNSKGNGTVMRCSPVAFYGAAYGFSFDETMLMAGVDARVTHQHPLAAESSAFLVTLYRFILQGDSLEDATKETSKLMRGMFSGVVSALVKDALVWGQYEQMRTSMGGWVAEEALALAVGAVIHSSSYSEVVIKACAIPGDSDTVAGIAGGLAAAVGMGVPSKLISKLNIRDPINFVLSL